MQPSDGLIKTMFEITEELFNKHKNSRIIYYSLAFEEGIEDYKAFVGLSPNYISKNKKSTVALEAHSTYLKKMGLGLFEIKTRIWAFDKKRAHIYQEIFQENTLIGTQETLSISFDIELRKTCDFDENIADRYEELHHGQKQVEKPKFIGLYLSGNPTN